jgi:uncharacterized protein YndB with AHSA1/START domain
MTDSVTTLASIERKLELAASPDRVWRAITDPDELSQWFPDRAEIELREGADGKFHWDTHGSFAVRVEAIERPRYFAWRWANDANKDLEDAEEVTLVEWLVEPLSSGGTLLTVRESGFTSDRHRNGNDTGWTSELAELVDFLD